MTVYNEENNIFNSIESILNQTHKNFEFIIVNDGSTDHTKKILKKVKDKRVKLIHLKKNKGAAKGLDLAIHHTSSKWIFIQDGDDISLPNRLEEQIKFIKKNPEIKVVASLIDTITDGSKKMERKSKKIKKYSNSFQTMEQIHEELYHACPICHGSIAFSKDLYFLVGGYSTFYKIGYDWDLWQRFGEVSSIAKVPKVLYRYRVDKKSLSHENGNATKEEMRQISICLLKRRFAKTKNPQLFMFGSEKKTNIYQKLINQLNVPFKHEMINNWDDEWLVEVLDQWNKREVNGIIILDGIKEKKALIDFFKENGLIQNKNLFNFI